MPSETSAVGPLTIPLPSEGATTPISDPTITGFLDFFRFWIRDGLTTKIAEPNDTQPDPLPSANLYPYDPKDNWVRNTDSNDDLALPALYIWQYGMSKLEQYSILLDKRVRTLRLMYVAQPIFGPEGTTMFSGLPAAVDAILMKASSRGRHSSYSYNGAPEGTLFSRMLGILGWKYEGGQTGMMVPVPATSDAIGGPNGGNIVHYYPALIGQVTVHELVEQETLSTADTLNDIALGINVNDPSDTRGPVRIMDRYLISPSETGDSGE